MGVYGDKHSNDFISENAKQFEDTPGDNISQESIHILKNFNFKLLAF